MAYNIKKFRKPYTKYSLDTFPSMWDFITIFVENSPYVNEVWKSNSKQAGMQLHFWLKFKIFKFCFSKIYQNYRERAIRCKTLRFIRHKVFFISLAPNWNSEKLHGEKEFVLNRVFQILFHGLVIYICNMGILNLSTEKSNEQSH